MIFQPCRNLTMDPRWHRHYQDDGTTTLIFHFHDHDGDHQHQEDDLAREIEQREQLAT